MSIEKTYRVKRFLMSYIKKSTNYVEKIIEMIDNCDSIVT